MRIADLDTPALLVDLPKLRGNIERMAQTARDADLKLRPHTKTHKCLEIARMQRDAGAAGITVAKVGEAEIMAEAGFDDIFIAHEVVGAAKIERLLALAKRIKVAVGVDSAEVAGPLSSAGAMQGLRLRVLMEIDIGAKRCGVMPDKALEFARRLNSLPGVSLAGIFTYPGHVYAARSSNEVEGLAAYECRIMGEVTGTLAPIMDVSQWVSGGSTPTARSYTSGCGLTEIRPGTYIFNDRTQIDRWSATPDECALTVLATVVKVSEDGTAIVDAGTKSLMCEAAPASPGLGMLKEDNAAVIIKTNEEHGFLDLTSSNLKLRVGDKVEIIPNHCCTVTNLFDELQAVQDGEVVETWRVAARGKVQ
jgi:D-serine deaminase-like pyridoxal phosphate-dependent protein